jgi:Tfp pilus assembly protein PilO
MTPLSKNGHLVAVSIFAAIWVAFHFVILARDQDALTASEATFRTKRAEVSTLATIKTAQEDLLRFRTHLSKETDLPQLIAFLSRMSEAHGLAIPSVAYAPKSSDLPDVSAISITFTVSGAYSEIRTFIDAIERAKPFFIIEHLTLSSEREEETGAVKLQIKIAAYTRRVEATQEIAPKEIPLKAKKMSRTISHARLPERVDVSPD